MMSDDFKHIKIKIIFTKNTTKKLKYKPQIGSKYFQHV